MGMVDAFQGRPLKWNYVNLAERPDRDAHARAQFDKHGIEAERFEAFHPGDWTGNPRDVQRMRNRTAGAIGCYMSQLALIKSAVDTDDVVAVCEDDVVFCEDLPKRLNHASERMTWDWDILYLGATFHVPGEWCHKPDCEDWGPVAKAWPGHDAIPTGDPNLMRVFGMWGTYAYLVNGHNAYRVVELLEENIVRSDGIDHCFMRLGDKVRAFCMVPGAAWQYDNQSNIGDGMTIFSGFKKLGPYVWTDYMEDFNPTTFDWTNGA